MLPYFCGNEKLHKAKLRNAMLAERKKHRATPKAALQLLASNLWRKARSVALYVAFQGEAETAQLLENAWRTCKNVCLPRLTNTKRHEMDFFACAGWQELRDGPYGLREPASEIIMTTVDLLILPGLAFDSAGNRLGHGGGYYDRFLAANSAFAQCRIGLCHDYQLIDQLPHDIHDIKVHVICTEKGLQWL